MDLWHGTSGEYAGLDRFGRIVDMKFIDFSGTEFEFDRREYTYDRNSNTTSNNHTVYGAESQDFTYDALNRMTNANRGILDSSNQVYDESNISENINMDLMGNYTPTAGGLKINSSNSSITHAVNIDNEIQTLDRPYESGLSIPINDDFNDTVRGYWNPSPENGWSIVESDYVRVDNLTSGSAELITSVDFDTAAYYFTVEFPTNSSESSAGIILTYESGDHAVKVVLNRAGGTNGAMELYQMTNGTWGGAPVVSDNMTIADETEYIVQVERRQRSVRAAVVNQTGVFFWENFDDDLGIGKSGLISDKTGVKFGAFAVCDMDARDPKCQRISGSGKASYYSNSLLVEDSTHFDEVEVENFNDDDYMVEVDFDLNGGNSAGIWTRYTDANNGYLLMIYSSGALYFVRMVDGAYSVIHYTATWSNASACRISLSSNVLKVWMKESGTWNSTPKINVTDDSGEEIYSGGVAFTGDCPLFDNLKIGYDANEDDQLDASDEVVVDEDFNSTSISPVYDLNGNLVDDGKFVYIYDGWDRLVKVRASNDSDVVIQSTKYDGLDRRIQKIVTNSGEHDGTFNFYYSASRMLEIRDDDDELISQNIWGLQDINELVMLRAESKGDLYIHQDKEWNVISLTDLGGNVVERYTYTALGKMIVHQIAGYGDYNGDGVVDDSDDDPISGDSVPTGAQRIVDLDFDYEFTNNDQDFFDLLEDGIVGQAGMTASRLGQNYGFGGILIPGFRGFMYDAELGGYCGGGRIYSPDTGRFGNNTRNANDAVAFLFDGSPKVLIDEILPQIKHGVRAGKPGEGENELTVDYECHVKRNLDMLLLLLRKLRDDASSEQERLKWQNFIDLLEEARNGDDIDLNMLQAGEEDFMFNNENDNFGIKGEENTIDWGEDLDYPGDELFALAHEIYHFYSNVSGLNQYDRDIDMVDWNGTWETVSLEESEAVRFENSIRGAWNSLGGQQVAMRRSYKYFRFRER